MTVTVWNRGTSTHVFSISAILGRMTVNWPRRIGRRPARALITVPTTWSAIGTPIEGRFSRDSAWSRSWTAPRTAKQIVYRARVTPVRGPNIADSEGVQPLEIILKNA